MEDCVRGKREDSDSCQCEIMMREDLRVSSRKIEIRRQRRLFFCVAAVAVMYHSRKSRNCGNWTGTTDACPQAGRRTGGISRSAAMCGAQVATLKGPFKEEGPGGTTGTGANGRVTAYVGNVTSQRGRATPVVASWRADSQATPTEGREARQTRIAMKGIVN